jgi:hypothetical protein
VLIMSANAINKAGVLCHVQHVWYCCKFGNCIICTNVVLVSKTCILGNVNHLWHCSKLEDLIMCGGVC